MCKKRSKIHPMLYSTIYDDAYLSKDRNKWINDMLNKCKRLSSRERIFTLQLMMKAVSTQSIFKNVSSSTYNNLICFVSHSIRERNNRLKYIQKKTLQHMYKPHGSMFWKNYKDLLEK